MSVDTELKPLRRVIRDVFDGAVTAERSELVDPIMDSISPADYGVYLREAIRMIIPTIVANVRRADFGDVLRGVEGDEGPRTEIQVDPLTLEEKRVQVVSPKRAVIRDAWQRFLSRPIPTQNGNVLLRDATFTDLMEQAVNRRTLAAKLSVESAKWEWVASRLKASGKETLGELDHAELLTIQRELEM